MKASIPQDYSDRVKRLRQKLGLTQAEMAGSLGVSFATVNRWENEQTRPSKIAWQKIVHAEHFGIRGLTQPTADTPSVAESPGAYFTRHDLPVNIDFTADPENVRLVVEGHRLTYGHLTNPAFATEISLIEPLPHQRIAVYERMLNQTRLRFLLADDAGAGKTIMSGLYIREMLARRLVRRVLIVPPAGLVGNWESEMHKLFRLPFRVVAGSEARSRNPFIGPESNLLIVSVDTLAGKRMFARLQEKGVTPYDLVIFDEAHKLSADREPDFYVRKTDRYHLGEALAGISDGDTRWSLDWTCHHLLLLTATPHMGKDYPYYCLWRLLEPHVYSTVDAFNAFPRDARSGHFIRRTKEEMVHANGDPIYPKRTSDTLSYELTQGEVSEQELYDQTTNYIGEIYNRAAILNRSAARFVMSVFQRRLASSTYALMESFKRRINKLQGLIDDIKSGRISEEQLRVAQDRLKVEDVLDERTADEEEPEDGKEQNEAAEEKGMGSVVWVTLAELESERERVKELLALAERVYEAGEESKFEKLREVLQDPEYRDEKIIIFTEHRDTLNFLVGRLEGLGYTGHVAQIHGGMDYRARQDQMEFFQNGAEDGGARFLVATDAAGEGINLQFCWLMVNYDIPWNPARLEQRMGRIHRYGQKHDPVVIINLIAGKTREGRVLKTLLEKLERIRKELKSDKVFDVVGRLFEDISIKDYMEQAVTEEGARRAERQIQGTLTKEQVEAIHEREKSLYGNGGEVKKELPRLRQSVESETYLRLLPGYVRHFVERSAPRVNIGIEGSLDGTFSLQPEAAGALDIFLPVLESYLPKQRHSLTVNRPDVPGESLWLHPGEPLFDTLRDLVCRKFGQDASRGGVFVDPTTDAPYLYHLAIISVVREAHSGIRTLSEEEVLEYRLLGLKQREGGQIEECPLEYLLLLKGGKGLPTSAVAFAATAQTSREVARAYSLERAKTLAEARSQSLAQTRSERETFIARGFDYQDAELAAARSKQREKAATGDARAKGELTRIKDRQRSLDSRREEALGAVRAEPGLIAPGEVTFLAHALVVPTDDPEDREVYDEAVEEAAMKVASVFEERRGAAVKDVHTPPLARAAGLPDSPGFDLLSKHPGGEERDIEVKGRARGGHVELTENEYIKACNLRNRYWLYVVYDCATPHPRLRRIQDPFGKLIVKSKGGVVINQSEVMDAAEADY